MVGRFLRYLLRGRVGVWDLILQTSYRDGGGGV